MSVLLVKLAGVLGLSLTSGINLYATVAVVGLVSRFDLVDGLPAEFQAFDNDFVIGLALLLYACEFLADKIPAFDSFWDSVHTVIRPFGAALIAVTVVGDAEPVLEICAGLLGAGLGLATHTAKAGTRLIANTSPEPFSNVALSVGEDVAVAGITVLVLSHPYLSLAVSLAVIALLLRYGPGLWRGALIVLRAVPAKIAALLAASPGEIPSRVFVPDSVQEAIDARLDDGETVRLSLRCHARKVKGCGRNRSGYLLLTDRRLLFAYRRWFRARTIAWDPAELGSPALGRGILLDTLRLRDGERFVSFIFVKHAADPAAALHERLRELLPVDDRTVEGGRLIAIGRRVS